VYSLYCNDPDPKKLHPDLARSLLTLAELITKSVIIGPMGTVHWGQIARDSDEFGPRTQMFRRDIHGFKTGTQSARALSETSEDSLVASGPTVRRSFSTGRAYCQMNSCTQSAHSACPRMRLPGPSEKILFAFPTRALTRTNLLFSNLCRDGNRLCNKL
jgi:hypothetical protein